MDPKHATPALELTAPANLVSTTIEMKYVSGNYYQDHSQVFNCQSANLASVPNLFLFWRYLMYAESIYCILSVVCLSACSQTASSCQKGRSRLEFVIDYVATGQSDNMKQGFKL